jgi:Ca2+-binding EF-hand superfamily protein
MQETTIDIKGFRKDVINKLAYKGPSNISKENVLLKIFKFYDLNSKGTLSREEFLKSVAKIGVVLTTQEVRVK